LSYRQEVILLARTCLTYLQAKSGLAWREQRGEVSVRMIIVIVLLIVAWQMFPGLFTGFFAFVHDMFFDSLEKAKQDGRVHGPTSPSDTKSPSGGGAGVQTNPKK
jgi:hypothetical protein